MQVVAREREVAAAHADPEALWLEFRRTLRAFVARRVPFPADVDDIVQWVFLQLHRRLADVRNGDRIHAWLYTTARRAIADYYRSGVRRHEVPSGDALDLDRLEIALEAPAESETRAEVAACLAPVVERLAPPDREAIELVEIQGVRLAEAAERSGVSLPGMKSRIQRARRRLKEAMLACCRIALDGTGVPIACETKKPDGSSCGAC
jgi:RNA polymerase sigma-70 factor (ECF subfamily)